MSFISEADTKKEKFETILKTHMRELKNRIGYVFFSFASSFIFAYCKVTQFTYIFLLSFSFHENSEKNFIFTDIHEAFSSAILICFITSLFCVLPFVLYEIFCFIVPSWYLYEKRNLCLHVAFVYLYWIGYIFSIHSFILPKLCSFLLQFQVQKDCLSIVVEPKILSYVSWASNLFFLATILFLSIYAFYLCFLHDILDVTNWREHRKISFIISLFFAGLVSPPDLWGQLLFTLTLFVICEFLILSCYVSQFIKNKIEKSTEMLSSNFPGL